MRLSRRDLLASGAALMAMPLPAMAARFVDLSYSAGELSWPGGSTPAACGRGGVTADKREGDGASPAGTFPLVCAFYRPDRLAPPPSGLPVQALQPNDGWVDDPADPQYNRLVRLPYPAHHEEMWRPDGLYDLVVVIGYNTAPPVPGRGSAIFLHVARPSPEPPARAGRPGIAPTAGCIAIAREALYPLLGSLGPGSRITIRR
jgi:L,D-peptidoglycan transpeptidase YkuD (ErfK/YbiS/YcfS/YnhG family)